MINDNSFQSVLNRILNVKMTQRCSKDETEQMMDNLIKMSNLKNTCLQIQ